MSSSDDDAPLVRKSNGVKSTTTISPSVDKAMDKQYKSNGNLPAGVPVAIGAGDEMDVDEAAANGASKRKSRSSTTGKSYREASSDDDDMPLNKRRRTSAAVVKDEDDSDDEPLAGRNGNGLLRKISASDAGLSDSDDEPITTKLAKDKKQIEKAAEKKAKQLQDKDKTKRRASRAVEESSDDDVPLAKKPAAKKRASNGVKREDSDDDTPRRKKTPAKSKVKSEEPTPKKGKKAAAKAEQEEEDEEAQSGEEEYRWWDDPSKGDNSVKWTTLEHNGVTFPPPYEPLPKNVKLIYDGTPVTLHPDSEEIAGFYGAMLNSTVNVENPTFNKNFFDDFKKSLDETGHGKDRNGNKVKITSFDKCDFKAIFEYYDTQRAQKRNATKEEKKALKEKKDKEEAPYMYCTWDGRKEKVGNFRVEPPGLFRGRGEHPKTGRVKQRVNADQITINIGKEARVPQPPPGQKWKEIKHDNTGTWLAQWQENINGAYKYVMLSANSVVKGKSDFEKFEKARKLKKYIGKIRKDYGKDLKSEVMADRQRATAIYFIDKFALRAGNEKGEDEADTVGCCSLKYENVILKPPNIVLLDFIGKDSIRFQQEVIVEPQVFKNLKIFKKAPKKEGDEIFDRLTTSSLNKHLTTYMPGLTAKVFRTYNASWTMAQLLNKIELSTKAPIAEKIARYNSANREVAILCNHKRTVGVGHANAITKMEDKIKALKYQQWRTKMMMIDLDSGLKKKKGAKFFEKDEDLDDEWIKAHQESEVELLKDKIRKKFEKDNDKLKAEGEKEMKAKELDERLKDADDLAKKFKKENKSGKVEAEGRGIDVAKLEAQLKRLGDRITTANTQMNDREENKEVALGTSKINYIDPRLSVVFSKKFDVPMEKLFSKTLRDKFDWAIKSVDEDWEF